MTTLKNSRGKFFHVHKMPPDLNFWLHFLQHAGRESDLDPALVRRARDWRPERSNCPRLSFLLEDLIAAIPAEWRALATNLFAGRVLQGDVNAAAWTERKAGILEINVQYSFTLSAYAAAYDEFFHHLRDFSREVMRDADTAQELSASINKRFLEPWGQLENARKTWIDRRLVATRNPVRRRLTLGREDLQEDMVDAAESFVIAHELAHHLLGHTVSRRDKKRAKVIVDQTVEKLGLYPAMAALNTSQREELQADLLGYLIVAQAVEREPTFSDLYRAVAGSSLALITLAHVTQEWVESDSAGTHPGFVTRFAVLQSLTESFTVDSEAGEIGDHPLGFLAQLSTFAAVALSSWMSRRYPGEQPATIEQALSHLIRLMDRVHSGTPTLRAPGSSTVVFRR
ncbi:hypothetical protein [Micromonospora zamorensis]|uniref:hypothetical protein n=1 Tax=Micromonospora zamorensis TaxID=709883 RepID=UPI0033BD4C55